MSLAAGAAFTPTSDLPPSPSSLFPLPPSLPFPSPAPSSPSPSLPLLCPAVAFVCCPACCCRLSFSLLLARSSPRSRALCGSQPGRFSSQCAFGASRSFSPPSFPLVVVLCCSSSCSLLPFPSLPLSLSFLSPSPSLLLPSSPSLLPSSTVVRFRCGFDARQPGFSGRWRLRAKANLTSVIFCAPACPVCAISVFERVALRSLRGSCPGVHRLRICCREW